MRASSVLDQCLQDADKRVRATGGGGGWGGGGGGGVWWPVEEGGLGDWPDGC